MGSGGEVERLETRMEKAEEDMASMEVVFQRLQAAVDSIRNHLYAGVEERSPELPELWIEDPRLEPVREVCIVLYCIVFYCIVLVMCCIVLYCIVAPYRIPYYLLNCITCNMYYVLHCIVIHYNTVM